MSLDPRALRYGVVFELGEDLPIEDLIAVRRRQADSLHAYNEAHVEWKRQCAALRWWQRRPAEPRIGDFD